MRFTVAGRIVFTTGDTEYEKRSCSAMRNGLQIEVKGILQVDGTVRAQRIQYLGL